MTIIQVSKIFVGIEQTGCLPSIFFRVYSLLILGKPNRFQLYIYWPWDVKPGDVNLGNHYPERHSVDFSVLKLPGSLRGSAEKLHSS